MEAHLTKAQRRKRENRELIRRMYLAGSSREEIAEAAGYAVGTVCEYLSDMGMLRRQDDGKRLEKMLRLHDEGKSLKEIGAEVGLSIGRVSAVLGKNGRRRVMIMVPGTGSRQRTAWSAGILFMRTIRQRYIVTATRERNGRT